MEKYQHAVFFETNNSLDIAQIQKYFQIKRKSGGGECEILKFGANTYKISFRDKEGKQIIFFNQVTGLEMTHIYKSCLFKQLHHFI